MRLPAARSADQHRNRRSVVVTTDSQGQYQFTDVHIGQYKIDAGARGFNETVTDPFTVAVNARQRVDVPSSWKRIDDGDGVGRGDPARERDQ